MALKPDEIFVQNCLLKHLDSSKASSWEGEDPPDIYIETGGETIAVEITRLSPVSFATDGGVQNRHSQDYFGLNLCDDLNGQFKDSVPPEVNIILTLHVPIENTRKYKKEIYSYIEHILASGIKVGDRTEKKIAGSLIKTVVVPRHDHAQKRIGGVIVNNNSSAHILSNAEVILADRISVKVEKCKKINHEGSLWLALFNDYWLADHNTYSRALKNIHVHHNFDKIFVVSDQGLVNKLYEKHNH
jgi:hypothetical protein